MNDLFIFSEDGKTILSVTDKNIKNIVIPNGVTKIGNSAFEYCDYLEAIEIPNGIMEIGEEAFYGCSALKSITLPN
ncbi:MAG: leucine-rich repeat domain-containing protein, partial [Bacteroidaceae bacterium]|nr:leucine-rich repeat domain-containing protein [Bacteroidaceae bacterium]